MHYEIRDWDNRLISTQDTMLGARDAAEAESVKRGNLVRLIDLVDNEECSFSQGQWGRWSSRDAPTQKDILGDAIDELEDRGS